MLLGGALDTLMETLILTLFLVVPCAGLTAAGVILCRRWRSAATAMIALGFAATLLIVGVLGMWVAAAGTLWHVRLHR